VLTRLLDAAGPVLCGLGAACMLAALAVDLDSTAARALMAAAAILFVPGAILTLVFVRRYYGPGR
jgi:membrane protein implicated in regulation of membrane protease activity